MTASSMRIGRYELQECVGRGGMGEVWKAFDTQLLRYVAFKLIRAELQSDPDFVTRFQREAQMIASLHHPNIVKLFDFQISESSESGNTIYMIMDYVEGQTLAQYIRKTARIGKFPSASDLVRLFVPISRAIDYAHSKGVIHRDIKPENILLDQRISHAADPTLDADHHIGEPVLTDFGIAKLVGGNANSMLNSGWLGTPRYTSPEQAQGLPGNERSDLYSLGIILYEMCTGVLPFTGDSVPAILMQHVHATPIPPTLVNPNLSPPLTMVILRSIAREPADRFSSATAMVKALCDALGVPISGYLHPAVQPLSTLDEPTEIIPRVSAPSLTTDLPAPLPPSATLPGVSVLGTAPMRDTPPIAQSPVSTQNDALSYTPGQQDMGKEGGLEPHTEGRNQPTQQRDNATKVGVGRTVLPRRSKATRIRNVLLVLLVVLLIAGGSSFFFLPFPQKTNNVPADITPLSGIGVTKAPDGEYIGISDGTFAFDTQRPNGSFKTQAAEQLKAHDFGSADSLWEQAVTQETNDAETLIYMEDRRIADAGDPYITIVVGTTLSGDANHIAIGREAVQAAYVAQREYNTASKLPGGVKVRLLIANSGKVNTYATTVAQQIVQLAQKDKTIVAVMGWTSTPTTLNAIGVLAPAKIPMVSNSGADQLTGRSPYFFRVDPPSSVQGNASAVYAEQRFQAKTAAVFFDPQNNFQLGLGNGFVSRFTADGNTVLVTEYYTAGKPEMLPKLLQDALSKHPDIIYFAGDSADAGGILPYLQPSDPPLLGGCNLYQLAGYSAETRKGWANTHVSLAAYSYPDEWDILELGAQKPPFFADYQADFDPNYQHRESPYGYNRPDGPTMELADTILALLYGCRLALAEKPTITGSDLQHALTQVTGDQAFQGVSSQISFGSDSNPIDRAIVFLCISEGKFFKMDGIYGKFLVGEPSRAQIFEPSACS
jgi:eukaryotic-like serine/threonine-protein kinase